jgi:hypothetical protein
MKLDRNLPGNAGRGKYALLKLRDLALFEPNSITEPTPIHDAIKLLDDSGMIDWGTECSESEFFVIRLRDQYARDALEAYAVVAELDDPEYGQEVQALADRAGRNSPFCKAPD